MDLVASDAVPDDGRARYPPRDIDREAALRAVDQARAAGVDTTRPGVGEVVELLGAAAAGVLPALLRAPALAHTLGDELSAGGAIHPAEIPPAPAPDAPREQPPPDVDETKHALRRMRDEALVRTALRELYALVDVDQTAREWSHVAARCTDHALTAAERIAEARNGPALDDHGARCPLVILGMGKLGGGELNLGSDIDICLFYGTDEGAAGERTLNQHFTRVGTVLLDLLADVTADGFAFRVDLRLRPEGSRGPVANSLASAERYYETWGRTWERAALLRARPIAGDTDFGHTLMDVLRPFVFRRSVTPSVALEVAGMLEQARREQLRDDARDLKLGHGGIREVEFFIQSLQLVWGGRHPSLQVSSTLRALARLHALGLISHRDARDLDHAWGLLRRVEHRIQAMAPYATHELPEDPRRQSALARSLGYTTFGDLQDQLTDARARVRALYATLFPADARPAVAPSAVSPEAALAARVAAGAPRDELAQAAAGALGVRDPEAAADDLARLARRADFPLGAVLHDRLPGLGAMLLAEVRDAPDPDAALAHLAELFQRVRPAERYARLLAEQPAKARGLVGLFGASEHLARTLLARPELIEAVVGGGGAPSSEELSLLVEATASLARREHPDDPDAIVGALRKATREATLAVGLSDMAGELETLEVTRRLSALAEANIREALALAAEETARRFGTVAGRGATDGIAVVSLGSLAARELGHGGDLDLLFVYEGEAVTSGGRREGVALGEYAVRLAQRTLSHLSMPHEAGPGYATDTRLRPAGSQGTLVTSREAFERYHATSQSWERQALLRARPVAGDEGLGTAVQSVIEAVAYTRGPADVGELRRLRARMELELGREDRGEVAIKYGRGALVDVEFAAQALQMAHGADVRVRTPNTRAALAALAAAGYLSPAAAEALTAGERLFRATLLAARLTTLRGTLVPSAPSAVTVARKLGYRDRGGRTALEDLLANLTDTREQVRRVFREVLTGLE